MQLSRFATNIKIDEDDYMLYSLKTRQYYPYKKEAQEQLEKLLDELNKGEYTLEEIQCIEKLMKKIIVIVLSFAVINSTITSSVAMSTLGLYNLYNTEDKTNLTVDDTNQTEEIANENTLQTQPGGVLYFKIMQ